MVNDRMDQKVEEQMPENGYLPFVFGAVLTFVAIAAAFWIIRSSQEPQPITFGPGPIFKQGADNK